jgi:16S rRNA (guanine(966)-N(2))-methyltransferase RsmD
MRIISGTLARRKIVPPKNLDLRPTTDQAKEGLFNILNNRIYFDEQKVLDLFSGTGSISLEFISRGVMSVTAVENNFKHFKFINEIKQNLSLENLNVLKTDVFRFLEINKESYSLIFADPPYNMPNLNELPKFVLQGNHLKDGGLFILEHSGVIDFSSYSSLKETRNYGKVHFSFFEKTL